VSEKTKGRKAKDSKGKGKKGKSGPAVSAISIAGHPYASSSVRSFKAWGGLIGFSLAAFLSSRAGVPLTVLGLRAIVAGVAGYMIAWWCGVAVWRAIVAAEARAMLDRRSTSDSAEATSVKN